jgi:hypothetical protein
MMNVRDPRLPPAGGPHDHSYMHEHEFRRVPRSRGGKENDSPTRGGR